MAPSVAKLEFGTENSDMQNSLNNSTTMSSTPVKASNDPPSPKTMRRPSNGVRSDLMEMNHLASAVTVDSWGGNVGIPPLASDNTGEEQAPQGGEVKVTHQAEDIIEDDISDIDDQDDIATNADYVDINKLLTPSSSEYYYSPANMSNRQIIEKVKKRNVKNDTTLEESGHSRVSILSTRSNTSKYRGPVPRKKDGSLLRSAMKRNTGNKGVMRMSSGMSDFDSSTFSANSRKSAPVPQSKDEQKSLRRCAFSSVDIREHERVAGDNPCVTSGVPLALGWGYYQNPSVSINDYELNKGVSRDKVEMMVPANIRRQMLRDDFDVAVSDLNAAIKLVNITKRQRKQTVAAEHMEGFQEATQSISRKFKRFVKRTSKSKEEKKMWEEAKNKVTERNDVPPAQIRFTAGGD